MFNLARVKSPLPEDHFLFDPKNTPHVSDHLRESLLLLASGGAYEASVADTGEHAQCCCDGCDEAIIAGDGSQMCPKHSLVLSEMKCARRAADIAEVTRKIKRSGLRRALDRAFGFGSLRAFVVVKKKFTRGPDTKSVISDLFKKYDSERADIDSKLLPSSKKY